MLLVGALVITNAVWFYKWRVRAVDHAEALAAATASSIPQERVVYEYRSELAPERVEQIRQRQPVQATLAPNEECRGGVVIKRTSQGLKSSGKRC